MAYIESNEEDLIDGQQGNSNQEAPQVGGSSQLVSGGQGVSNAGVGAGGTGGWTNIQAYLGANKGDTGSSQALNKTVSDQFGQERSQLESGAADIKAQSQKQVDDNKVSNEQADQQIKSAADNYSWDGNQKSEYASGVQKMQGALNNQYAGPKSYNYAFNTQTQNYGNQLKDDTGFGALMKNVYSNAAGKPLSSGQYALQEQLDVNNQGLVDTRKNLSSAYDQLGAYRDKTVQDTTSALGANEQAYRTNQNALRDYLGQQVNKYDTGINQAEIDARAKFGKEESTTGPSLWGATANYNQWAPEVGGDQFRRTYGLDSNYRIGDKKLDFTRSNEYVDTGSFIADKNFVNQAAVDANNWYFNQDLGYQNTADPEKRSYNALLDFLNSTDERKKQGFAVRG